MRSNLLLRGYGGNKLTIDRYAIRYPFRCFKLQKVDFTKDFSHLTYEGKILPFRLCQVFLLGNCQVRNVMFELFPGTTPRVSNWLVKYRYSYHVDYRWAFCNSSDFIHIVVLYGNFHRHPKKTIQSSSDHFDINLISLSNSKKHWFGVHILWLSGKKS